MSCNNKRSRLEDSKSKSEPLTFWEKFVLNTVARYNKVMIFDLELDGQDRDTYTVSENRNDDMDHSPRKLGEAAADLDAATQIMMSEGHAQKATTSTYNTPDEQSANAAGESSSTNSAPEAKAKLPAALLASLESVRALSQKQSTQRYGKRSGNSNEDSSTSTPRTSNSCSNTNSNTPKFGPAQTAALSSTILHEDAARQEALISTRQTDKLSMQRRFLAEEEDVSPSYRDSDLMMSGALDAGDPRCDVCEKREREVEALVESGVVAL